jgi:hypothetical protein
MIVREIFIVRNTKPYTEFKRFILERSKIAVLKSQGKPWPWSKDHTLNRVKINNIFRQLDSTTQYELNTIQDLQFEEQVRIILLLRYILSVPTTKYILSEAPSKKNLQRYYNETIYREAFVNSGAIQFYVPSGIDIVSLIYNHTKTVNRIYKTFAKKIKHCSNPEQVINLIREKFGYIGEFKSYEIYTSLTYCNEFQFSENDILVIGPGAIKDAQVILGSKVSCLSKFQEVSKDINNLLEARGLLMGLQYTVRSLEDSLCEFRKYKKSEALFTDYNNRATVRLYTPSQFINLPITYRGSRRLRNKANYLKILDSSYSQRTKFEGRMIWDNKVTFNNPLKLYTWYRLPNHTRGAILNFIDGKKYTKDKADKVLATASKSSMRYLNDLVFAGFFKHT